MDLFLEKWKMPDSGQKTLPLMHKLKGLAGIVEPKRDRACSEGDIMHMHLNFCDPWICFLLLSFPQAFPLHADLSLMIVEHPQRDWIPTPIPLGLALPPPPPLPHTHTHTITLPPTHTITYTIVMKRNMFSEYFRGC